MTSVVNVRVNNIRPRYNNLEEWMKDKNNVYIGRSGIVFIDNKRYPPNGSIWANPYKVVNSNREMCIRNYEIYIREKIEKEYGIDELMKLEGKKLGCWCHPNKCHGDILVKLIEEYKIHKL